MTLLAGVLLSDLEFNGLVGVWKSSHEERAHGLAHLKVDGTVLDLHDDVRVKFTVERVEVVVACAGAVGFQVVPIEMIVVDEAAIEDDAAMRPQRARYNVRGVGRRTAVLRWAGAALRVSL